MSDFSYLPNKHTNVRKIVKCDLNITVNQLPLISYHVFLYNTNPIVYYLQNAYWISGMPLVDGVDSLFVVNCDSTSFHLIMHKQLSKLIALQWMLLWHLTKQPKTLLKVFLWVNTWQTTKFYARLSYSRKKNLAIFTQHLEISTINSIMNKMSLMY